MRKLLIVAMTFYLVTGCLFGQSLPKRLLVEFSDYAANQIRENNSIPESLTGAEFSDLEITAVFYRPHKSELIDSWYKHGLNRWFRLSSSKYKSNELAELLEVDSNILSFELISPIELMATPDDYEIVDMWGLEMMSCPSAWDIYHGDSPVIISTIDTGCRIDHPDLAANIYINPGEDLNNNGIWDNDDENNIDDDNNGFIDDIAGWDFCTYLVALQMRAEGEDYGVRDNEVFPDIHGHGTHVAGTAAAVTDNATGVAAASWNVKSMPLKAGIAWINLLDELRSAGQWDDFAVAVQYATDNSARIISISFGGEEGARVFENALNYARDNNVIVFTSAGNDNVDDIFYPAIYESVIAVAATNQNDGKAYFSNFGEWVGISAPGMNIWSTMSNNIYHQVDYAAMQGTSMASPNAAAVAALVLSYNPDLTDDELEEILYNSADNIDGLNPGYVGQLGAGRVNAENALLLAEPWIPVPPSDLHAVLNTEDGSVQLSWYHDYFNHFSTFRIYRNDTEIHETASNNYQDLLPDFGEYSYSVSALYDDGESEQTESVNIEWSEAQQFLHFTPVTPTGFPYDLLVNQVLLNNQDMVVGDEIGIYDGDLCVGAGIINGEWPLRITSWEEDTENQHEGFHAGNPINIMVWQQSGDQEYVASAEYLDELGAGYFGVGEQRTVILNANIEYQLSLPLQARYFELISTYILPENTNTDAVFSEIQDLGVVYSNDGNVYIPELFDNILNLEANKAYRIYCANNSEFSISGYLVDTDIQFHLEANYWNWLAYPFNYPSLVINALAEIEGSLQIVMADDGRIWVPGFINTLETMTPGEGYLVWTEETMQFTYPQDLPALTRQALLNSDFRLEQYVESTGLPYLVLVSINEDLWRLGPEYIEIYDGSRLVGKSLLENQTDNIPVICWGASEKCGLAGYQIGNPIKVKLLSSGSEVLAVEVVNVPGFGQGAYAEICLEESNIPSSFMVEKAYPNPFNSSIVVPFTLPDLGEVKLALYNILGQNIYSLKQNFEAGNHRLTLNLEDMQQAGTGIYFLKIEYKHYQKSQKVILLR